jgi:hypothetical protein
MSNMDNITKAQILEAIRTRITNGLNYQQIESEFIDAGYTKEQIHAFYNEAIESQVQNASDVNSDNFSEKPSHKTTIFVASFFFVCAIVVVLAGWLFKDNLVVFIDSFTPKSELTLSVFDSWIDASSDHISLGKVTEKQAERLCGIGSHDTSCQWGEAGIEPSEDYTGDFAVTLLASDEYLKEDEQYEIGIENALRNRTYRVFILHEDLLGRLNGINEVILTEAGSRNGMRIYTWDLSQVSGFIAQSETLPEGTYSIVAVEVETGFVSEKSDWFRVKSEDDPDQEDNIARAANTPLIDSYWDGRGVFVDGGPSNEDTVSPRGDVEMYDIFRGVDFPEKDELNTVVLVQGGGVVIVLYNIEFINFDNREFTIEELLTELAANDGAMYSTKPFDVEVSDRSENTENEEKAPVITPENIDEFTASQERADKINRIRESYPSPGPAASPSIEIVEAQLPVIYARYSNLPPVAWHFTSVGFEENVIFPFEKLETGGSGVVEIRVPAMVFGGPGEYVIEARSLEDSDQTYESQPFYIELPEKPKIIEVSAVYASETTNEEVVLTWESINADYCRIRDAAGKVFADEAPASGSMSVTIEPEESYSTIFDFYCFSDEMSNYGFTSPNNLQWDNQFARVVTLEQ